MSEIPVLYHAEHSSRSQLCRIALAEKGIKYRDKLLTLFGDQHDPQYLRVVNPNGTVPTLEHGQKYLTDSKDILYYVDNLPSDKPALTFQDDPEVAERVRRYTALIDSLSVPVLTYGSFIMRQFTKNSQAPNALEKENLIAMVSQRLMKLQLVKKENPDLDSIVEAIVERMKGFLSAVVTEDVVARSIEDCEKVFNEVEKELQREAAGGREFWLCGHRFTVADIYLSVLLHRLVFVGLAERVFLNNRPLITDYYNRVQQRPSFKIACQHVNKGRYWMQTVSKL